MRHFSQIILIFFFFISFKAQAEEYSFEGTDPGTVYLFSYTTNEHQSRNGLYFAWSTDQINWHKIGPEFGFLRSDYGAWGSQKRLVSPFLFYGDDEQWHCVWSVNENDDVFAHAASEDLISWKRQIYPYTYTGSNIVDPQVVKIDEGYEVNWVSNSMGSNQYYKVTTSNFRTFSVPESIEGRRYQNNLIIINGQTHNGYIHQVKWDVVQKLIDHVRLSKYEQQLFRETTDQDPERFKDLKSVSATMKVKPDQKKTISDKLMGIFFEDISYAADGGLYAELIRNRDFEFHPRDVKFQDPEWNAFTGWLVEENGLKYDIDSIDPIHENNPHYVTIKASPYLGALINRGFDGIPVKEGETYDLSCFVKKIKGNNELVITLEDGSGEILCKTAMKVNSSKWVKETISFTATGSSNHAELVIRPQRAGEFALDMVSLFPRNTFKGRKNGLRADLVQAIADLHPKFVRFPGGCVAHGDGLDNMYRWKNTIGPLEERVPQQNIWNYHQTAGLGYFEYFQFCEDIDAIPIPIIPAGVPCQNSGTGGSGQQCGIPMEEMEPYIQEIFDLVEWANGSADTVWGRKRAEAGHPEPFNLKYIGIGNEDLITDVFEERYTMIIDALREKYPELIIIGTVGPFYKGTDYEEGWDIAEKLDLEIVDEHYYESPGWFIHNQDYYDKYDRSKSKVYLGEYAAHLPGRPNNIETALAEAIYLTALERNGDIVEMASYAPLLAKEGRTNWNPDLIYFNNTEVKPTTGYYVQKLFGEHTGTTYYQHERILSENSMEVQHRIGSSVVECDDAIIVKMVNILPVKVGVSIDLKGLVSNRSNAVKYVLAGHPDGERIEPVMEDTNVDSSFMEELIPYSLTVWRIEKN